MPSAWIYILPAVALIAWLGAMIARRYALARHMVDHPGERRSHRAPVPRGGGVGIPLALLLLCLLLALQGRVSLAVAVGFGGGLALVALAGWLDDRGSLPIAARLGIHAGGAAWLLWWTGGLTSVELGGTLMLGAAGHFLALVGCVWLTNLYNFMDGIDALAASEGLFAGAVMGGWFLLAGEYGIGLLALGTAFACAGFLPWNLPPARLFMGDVGSTSLGFAFAALALQGEQTGALPVVVSVIVLGVFIFDATFTLLARMLRGARWYTPHREHAYQYLVRAGFGHGHAVRLLAAVNLLVILPVVVVSYRWPGSAGLVLAACTAAALGAWLVVRKRCAAMVNFT